MIYPSENMQPQAAIIRHPRTVSPDVAVLDVIAKLDEWSQGETLPPSCILIVDDQQVLGIFTPRDVLHLIVHSVSLENLAIRAVMTQPVISLIADECIDPTVALAILEQNHISHLPLIDRSQKLIGLLTRESLQPKSSDHQLESAQISQLQQELAEQRRSEENLRQHNQELVIKNEEFARAMSLKDEFLTNMSHELRTPLNAIVGMTDGLKEGIFGETTEAQIEAVQTIEQSSHHLLELINDILDLSKIGAGQLELQFMPTNIYNLCHASLAFVKQQALKKRIKLQIQLPSSLPQITIDERRIRQALINLLSNAVKFTPMGGNVALQVTVETDNMIASFIRLNVIDAGIGIHGEDLPKLFQPFTQIKSITTDQNQGTGLGLSLVKKIIEMHDGIVSVKSEIGIGSQFMIDLPIRLDKNDGNKDLKPKHLEFLYPNSPVPDTTTSKPLERSWTILLAEDNAANIASLSSYLKAKGYEVIIAKDGIEAVDIAKAQLPGLILMDIQMPNMDGLTAIGHIRAEPTTKNIPIIALTALAMHGDREKCLNAGANDYLSKPIALRQLSTTIQKLLESTSLVPTGNV